MFTFIKGIYSIYIEQYRMKLFPFQQSSSPWPQTKRCKCNVENFVWISLSSSPAIVSYVDHGYVIQNISNCGDVTQEGSNKDNITVV